MTQEEAGRLPQVLARVGTSHGITDLACKLRFYDDWAPEYDQDVAALKYRAPRLAVDCLSRAFRGSPHDALILDVACGTGLVAVELQARGFLQVQGVDGSPEMLKQARARGLYHHLSLCTLGQEPLPDPEGTFDAVIIVGALSEGQVPCSAIPELLRVTKPGSCPHQTTVTVGYSHDREAFASALVPDRGGLVCLTTRTNPSNLPYKETLEATLDSLERAGVWECLVTQPVDHWELATSEQETGLGTCANDGFISGIIYLYRKQETV
ncbi:methyltransferase-like protein 27 isoform X1 [Mus musculus]|nr:methyltransferase-like protein 27 isoform X1 [Mus musculus]XP_006504587.1 methyltransferase-like protein 27 isoform X1 [Mus musculus]XP_006504590.1 methyltransferase-like protein 27 isoform X1 [Mus musculus]XP_006504591.1 methyltransferase-like protein 27 isoform X1 [Mus musculus]XP_006504592.1 methyltransferase-like protein 27 isoform X1 [Mus musculus]|eukprot:XP_006504585.1 PREDICTED: Williams-Beuren syndrome chromosomal region 27 protein isoform X1 [Mus musculus]